MARPAKVRFLSPREAMDRLPVAIPATIPSRVVKALVSGLLCHLWPEHRRKPREAGIKQASIELSLMIHASLGSSIGDKLTDDALNTWMQSTIPLIFGNRIGHSWYIMNADSDRILDELASYEQLLSHGSRELWLKKELPGILSTLREFTLCTVCRGRTNQPSVSALSTWACRPGRGELRDRILAHYHRLTPLTVKRLLAEKPPQPLPVIADNQAR